MNPEGSTRHEHAALWQDWGGVEMSLPEALELRTSAHRQRKAIGAGSWQPTYEQLSAAAGGVGSHLLSRGGAVGDRVALLMRHDSPLVASVLGVLQAGRMVVALNPSDPPARLGQICRDAEPSLIITDSAHRDIAMEMAGATCDVAMFDELTVPGVSPGPGGRIAPDAPAFLLYTSGSTGGPKGVIQNHRNVLHTVRGYSRSFHLQASDRIALLGGLAGGQGVMTTFCALLNGATLYPYTLREQGVTPLPAWLARHRISVFISAATVFRQLANVMPGDAKLPHLRLVRLGAEPALRSDLDACRRMLSPDGTFASVMSSTETGNLTQFIADESASLEDGILPVGVPVEGKKVMLLRDDGTEARPGESGEIAVRSAYLSPGYWRDAALTQRVFHDVPGSAARVFHTGDLGRWRADGLLEHLGRKDQRFKLLGNRIDAEEVDASLRSHPSVCDAAVAVSTHSSGKVQLLAWIVPRDQGAFDPAAWRETLTHALPPGVTLARIMHAHEIPRTSNGKANVNLLLAGLDDSAPPNGQPPRTTLEHRIARVWAGALGRFPAGVYESFFEAGGDSLQAVDLMLGLSKEFGRDLLPELLITHPTIAQFAELMETGLAKGGAEPWFRLPAATLLPMRQGGGAEPIIFIPGGYTTERELLACAGLLPHLDDDHPASGVRLNLHARRVLPPLSLRGLARAIGRSCLAQYGRRVPVIVGECQACALACETALWLARKLGEPPALVLLDPWQPRLAPPGSAAHPPAVNRYYHLLRRHEPTAYAGEVHVVCASETGRAAACLEWWRARLGPGCVAGEVPGNHQTYIRGNRKHLAAFLNGVLHQAAARRNHAGSEIKTRHFHFT